MNKQVAMGILLLALGPIGNAAAASPQAAMQAKPDQKPTFAMVLDRSLTNVEHEVVPAADAMPEDKFNFAPTQGEFKGVRTFAQQVKHIATANYALGAGILAEKPPLDLESENGPAKITSKADVMQYLKDSFTYLHKAMNSIDENNVLGLVPEPVRTQQGFATRTGCRRDRPSQRSLRPDGRVSPDEQYHSSCKPAEVVRLGVFATITGARRERSRLFYCRRTDDGILPVRRAGRSSFRIVEEGAKPASPFFLQGGFAGPRLSASCLRIQNASGIR